MDARYELVVASPPDRTGLVVEIWYENEMFAEIANENSRLTIEIYPRPSARTWHLGYEEVEAAIRLAKDKLFGN